MIFGIKFQESRKGLKRVNRSMEQYGCAILNYGKLEYYFSNIASAYITAHKLQKAHNGLLSYNVFVADKETEKRTPSDKILGSYEEYHAIMEQKHQEAIQQLEELMNARHVTENTAEAEASI